MMTEFLLFVLLFLTVLLIMAQRAGYNKKMKQ